MLFPHIATKLHIPATRPALLRRPRLVAQLSRCVQRRLLLVSAPAGFGKTTALCQWSRESAWPIAWVSLDETDDDPIRFWSYLIAALDKLDPRVGEHVLPFVYTPRPAPIEYLIPTLINALDRIADDFCLVLDDYHCVESEAIHEALAYLLDYAPPHVHLVVATRSEPPLPLARWRARGQLAELGAADLCFSKEEATCLFAQVLDRDLPAEAAEALYVQTEGWIAGLQLAALALKEQEPHAQALERVLRGDHQYIVDYMASEVLGQQPEDVQAFLLQTAILDTLNAPLCDAVTGQEGSQAVLERLHQGSLFVAALDRAGHYRYHRLFADFLRGRLAGDPAYDLPALHLRAAEWYRKQGDASPAIRHYLAAGHEAEAVDLVEATAREVLMRGELKTLLDWFDVLPGDAIRNRPLLCLIYGWALTHAGRVDEAAGYLDCLEARAGGEQQAERLLGEAAAVRARMAVVRGDDAGMIRFSEQALALLPADSMTPRSDAVLDLAFAYGARGDTRAAQDALAHALDLSRQAGNLRAAMLSLYYLGDLYVALGEHQRAARLYQEGFQWFQESVPPSDQACWAHAGLGALLYEWNDLDGAVDHLQRAVQAARRAGEIKVLMYPRLYLARAYQAAGRTKEALAALQAAAEVAEQARIAEIANQIDVARVEVWTRAGQLDPTAAWLQRHGIAAESELLAPHEVTMLAWYHLAAGRDTAALAWVAGRLAACCDERYPLVLARDLALLACVYQALGRREEAIAAICRSLSLAEPMGLIRTLIDCGEPMARLLRAATGHPALPASDVFVARLRGAFDAPGTAPQPTPVQVESPASGTPFEPLRPREVEVLQHVAVGRSNSEIADEMVMAVSTVKWYLRNIYDKLQVHRRTQAVARARTLNLI